MTNKDSKLNVRFDEPTYLKLRRKQWSPWKIRISLLACLLLFCSTMALAQRVDPETGRVRILYIGDGWGPSPVPLLTSDPAFTVVSVPTSTLHADVAGTDSAITP